MELIVVQFIAYCSLCKCCSSCFHVVVQLCSSDCWLLSYQPHHYSESMSRGLAWRSCPGTISCGSIKLATLTGTFKVFAMALLLFPFDCLGTLGSSFTFTVIGWTAQIMTPSYCIYVYIFLFYFIFNVNMGVGLGLRLGLGCSTTVQWCVGDINSEVLEMKWEAGKRLAIRWKKKSS